MPVPLSNRPPLEIAYHDPAVLSLNADNARHHPMRQLRKMVRSFEAFGFTSPVIIDEAMTVLCGNLRVSAALSMGMKMIPTVMLTDLTEAEKKALALADNRIGQDGSWDRSKLRSEFEVLSELGYTLEFTGFDTIEIESCLSIDTVPAAVDTDDDVVDLDDTQAPVSRLGDLWHIGEHRIYCGDARDPKSYELLVGTAKAALIFVDPPYNIRIPNNVSGHGRVKHSNFLMGCSEESDPVFAETILIPALRLMGSHAAPGAIAFVCCDWRHVSLFEAACAEAFHEVKSLIVWAKTNASNSAFYRPQYELIWAWQAQPGPLVNNFQMGRKGAGLGVPGRNRSNLWTYAGANVFRRGRLEDLADHATVKPRKMVADAIRDCSPVGGIVLDGFLGSATTIVAAAMTGRVGYGIELDPKFCDVALRRVSEACGEPARLEGGLTFDEVAAQRQVTPSSNTEEASTQDTPDREAFS